MSAEAITELLKQSGAFLTNFGLPTGLLVLVMFCAWRFWTWFKPHGDQILQAHVGLVETLRRETPKQTVAMQTMSESVSQLATGKKTERDALLHLSKAIEETPSDPDRRKAVKVHTDNMREALE